jgi:hypothetical protein
MGIISLFSNVFKIVGFLNLILGLGLLGVLISDIFQYNLL